MLERDGGAPWFDLAAARHSYEYCLAPRTRDLHGPSERVCEVPCRGRSRCRDERIPGADRHALDTGPCTDGEYERKASRLFGTNLPSDETKETQEQVEIPMALDKDLVARDLSDGSAEAELFGNDGRGYTHDT